ncbi:solute carrier family 26 member 6-like [Rhipicephalus sanguineus]|uniref:solute carrier family 26 member 6-like n=1 Tax=Rhipicephalus sanguineus TaxID=34632 RepID=UPI0020C4BAFD|nr:solute carrier family 26 member 6-like [Rhipicephalus sanguineus]
MVRDVASRASEPDRERAIADGVDCLLRTTHKTECPLRVIVSEKGTWQDEVSSYLQRCLGKLDVQDPFLVRSSTDLVQDLAQVRESIEASGEVDFQNYAGMSLVLAIVAGVDPALGLYSSLYPTLVYVIMGTSPFVSMGMVPVSALMTGAVVQKYSVVTDNTTVTVDAADNLSTERSAADVAVTLTLLTGLIQVAMWILRLDQLAVIISPITGEAFLSGCSLAVIISQLPSVFGVDVKPTQGVFGAPLTLYHVSRTIPQSNIATSLLSLASFVVLLLAKGVVARKMRRFTAFPLPSDLLLVSRGATLSSHFLELDTKHDVRVVGHIKSGFPLPTVPSMNHWVSLLPDAAAIAIVQFVVTYAMAELFGRKRRLKTDASQEMLAYGMSGVVGSFFLCLPAGSSLSRSVVLKDVGSMTQVSGLVSSVFVALTLYAFASLFRPVPECVLAVLIIVLLLPMVFKLRNLPKLWMISRFDFVLWSLGFVSVVFLNATYGLMVGILLGLLTVFLELSR